MTNASGPHPLGGVLLFALALGEALFVGGILPIVEHTAAASAASIYATYFAGQVLGQVLIARGTAPSTGRWAYPVYEALFGLAVVGLGLATLGGPGAMALARGVEGLAVGLSMPLAFASLLTVPGFGGVDRRVSLFSSLFALGLVAGPPAVEALLAGHDAVTLLWVSGAAFVAAAAALPLLFPEGPGATASPAPPQGAPPPRWFEGFYGLFLAKSYYGFFLPYLASHLARQLAPLSVGQAMVAFAGLFVVGQALGAVVTRRVPAAALASGLPVAMALTLVATWATGQGWLLALAALVHAMLLFTAYRGAASRPAGAREFARINALSDPGLVVGALLAGLGPVGLLGVAALALAPLVVARAAGVRAR